MATTRKRSSASASISKPAIETVRSTLSELPEKPKENLSLREAIGELHESITDALNRGYSYEEVVEILSTQGVSITVASLKRYLAAARKEVADKPKRTRQTANRSRKAQLIRQSEDLSSAASPPSEIPASDASADPAPTETPKRRRTTSRTVTASKTATTPATKNKTAAKAKPTSRAKTTPSRSTSSRGRKRSSASE